MSAYDELVGRAFSLADDLGNGHYSMTEAIAMICEQAAAIRTLEGERDALKDALGGMGRAREAIFRCILDEGRVMAIPFAEIEGVRLIIAARQSAEAKLEAAQEQLASAMKMLGRRCGDA